MILSICIPSYNRFDELKQLLDSISRSNSSDFNVFIVDNGSNGDVCSIGSYDDRFKFIKRDVSVPGPVNVRTSLDYGDAEYIMLCLDKDFIKGEFIELFISELKKNSTITCGYCNLNSDIIGEKMIVNNASLDTSIYRCGHPSGYFFRKNIVALASAELDPYDSDNILYNNPFQPDLLYAYGLLNGKEGIYQGSLVITETLKKASETKSYTYTTKNNNIYFLPECRRKQMFLFIMHMETLEINDNLKKKIICRLIDRTMYDSTVGYQKIMQNEQICAHHSIGCKRITYVEMFREMKILVKEIDSSKIIEYGMFYKKRAIFLAKAKVIMKVLLKRGG